MNVMDKLFKDVRVIKAGPITGILSAVILFWFGVMLLLSVVLLVNHRLVHIDGCRVFLPIYEYAKLPVLLRGIDRKSFGFFCQFEVVWRVAFLFYVVCFFIFSLAIYIANMRGSWRSTMQIVLFYFIWWGGGFGFIRSSILFAGFYEGPVLRAMIEFVAGCWLVPLLYVALSLGFLIKSELVIRR